MNIGFEAKRIFHNRTGLGNYSRDLVRILSHYFPENKYLLYNPIPTNKNLFHPNNKGVIEKKPTSNFYSKFYNIWRQKGVVKDLVSDDIKLFHGLSGEIPSGLKKTNIKSIVTVHDLIFMKLPQFYSFLDRVIYFYKFRKSTKESDLVIAISEQTKSDLIKYFNVPSRKIKVIYQGCNPAFKKEYSLERKKAVIDKYNLPPNFILNVGTVEQRKNVLSAVKAITNIDTFLVIIGNYTSYKNSVEKYCIQNKIAHKVLFLNNVKVEELAIIYQLATLFIYPSLYEGFGIPIIESLYSKTPVITSKGGVFHESGGPSTHYINPANIDEIQQAIQLVLNDNNLRTEMAEKGYDFVQKFNDESIASNIYNAYKSLL
ncbi:MAG: glycosyltransferase family 4 protein [Flavobacterium sp.]|jgi:glycosyltransferase involved in cell wall biosynthesis|nr:glycosyltransferase family 4 protein [Flavobacterium sp.]